MMLDWRVLLLSTIGILVILTGLVVLAMPDSYEGGVLYNLDASHSVRTLDGIGLALVILGGTMTWGAGALWKKQVVS